MYFGGNTINLLQLVGVNPAKVPKIIENISVGLVCYEYDIPFVKRFLIDTGLRSLQIIRVKIPKESSVSSGPLEVSYKDVSPAPIDVERFPYKCCYMAFDIEVAAENESVHQLLIAGSKRIIAISVCWGTYNESFHSDVNILTNYSDDAETSLLFWFINKIRDLSPDVIITYNGDVFDFPYLVKRMTELKNGLHLFSSTKNKRDIIKYQKSISSIRIKGRIVVDLFYKTFGLHPTSGKKGLDDIAQMVLGANKEPKPENFFLTWQYAVTNPAGNTMRTFSSYSLRDAELTYKLFFALGVQESLEAVSLVGMPPAEGIVTTARNIGEFEVFRMCYIHEILIPSLPSKEQIKKNEKSKEADPHKGGLVLEPKEAFYRDVLITDFRSMYPSLMVAYNIGGESFRPTPEKKPEEQFIKEPQSVLAEMQKNILEKRIVLKNLYKKAKNDPTTPPSELETLKHKQSSLKLILNSVYGSHNYPRGRFFSGALANNITLIGRNYLLWLTQQVTQYDSNYEMIYGDTDSSFIWFKNSVVPSIAKAYEATDTIEREIYLKEAFETTENIVKYLNSLLPPPMELEVEDIAYKMAFKPGRRKSYSYVSAVTKTLYIKGFEAVRSDWSNFAKETQKAVLLALLTTSNENKETAKNILSKYIREIWTVSEKTLIEKLQIYTPLRKAPSKYKSKPPVIGAFLHYCTINGLDAEKEWREFDKFPWVVIKGKGPLVHRSRHPMYAKYIDRAHYVDQILSAAERFGINLTKKEKEKLQNQSVLDKYFSYVKT